MNEGIRAQNLSNVVTRRNHINLAAAGQKEIAVFSNGEFNGFPEFVDKNAIDNQI